MSWTPAVVSPVAPVGTPRTAVRPPLRVAGPGTPDLAAFARARHPAGRALGRTPVARAAARTSTPVHLRLTRRGRVVVLLALVTLLLAAFSLGRVGSNAAPASDRPATPAATTTVHPGESLWAVAKRVAPGQDPRGLVLRIQELNDLDGGAVQAGQLLVLPR